MVKPEESLDRTLFASLTYNVSCMFLVEKQTIQKESGRGGGEGGGRVDVQRLSFLVGRLGYLPALSFPIECLECDCVHRKSLSYEIIIIISSIPVLTEDFDFFISII